MANVLYMAMQQDPSDNTEIHPWKMRSSRIALNEKWFTVRQDTIQFPAGALLALRKLGVTQ